MFDKRILNVYSLVIGIFFFISGIGKAIDTAAFSNLIYQYGLGQLMLISPLIALIEISIGLFLILLINPKRYAFFSFILLIIFTISFAYAHFVYGVNDCGCLGIIQPSSFPPVFSFVRNFILMGMSLMLWIKYPKENIESIKWKNLLILIVMGIAIFISGFTYQTPFFLKGNPETHPFQNQNIMHTELSNYVSTSTDSTYLIFCFTYTCPHCWNSIANLGEYEKSNTVDRIVALATGETNDKLFFEQNFHPGFKIRELPKEKMHALTNAYPTAFYVEHDTIKVIIQSVLSSPITFRKQYKLESK